MRRLLRLGAGMKRCEICLGTGEIAGHPYYGPQVRPCFTCGGAGRVPDVGDEVELGDTDNSLLLGRHEKSKMVVTEVFQDGSISVEVVTRYRTRLWPGEFSTNIFPQEKSDFQVGG